MSDRVTTVFLADDHPIVADGLTRFLERQADVRVVGAVTSFQELERELATTRVCVVVADLGMPGMNGVRGVEAIRRWPHAPRVVIFSMQPEDRYALDLLSAGASAYLNKSRAPEELLEAIRRAARGQRYLTDKLAARLLGSADGGRARAHEGLSAREREVCERLARGLSSKEVAYELQIGASSVHTYTERIKRKLGVGSVAELVAYFHRHGLVD